MVGRISSYECPKTSGRLDLLHMLGERLWIETLPQRASSRSHPWTPMCCTAISWPDRVYWRIRQRCCSVLHAVFATKWLRIDTIRTVVHMRRPTNTQSRHIALAKRWFTATDGWTDNMGQIMLNVNVSMTYSQTHTSDYRLRYCSRFPSCFLGAPI